MPGEIQIQSVTGQTLYALVRNGAGLVWRPSISAFEAFSAANWGNYATAIGLTEQAGTGYFVGDFPAGIVSPGTYSVDARLQSGSAAAISDASAGGGAMVWTGKSEVSPANDPMKRGVVQASPAPTTTRFAGDSALSAADRAYGGKIVFLTGANQGQSRQITGYVGSTKTISCAAFPVAPSAGDEFGLYAG